MEGIDLRLNINYSRDWTFKIHYLMAAVVFLKSFSLLFHAVS